MTFKTKLRKKLGTRKGYDKKGRLVSEEIGLRTGLENLANFMKSPKFVIPILTGLVAWFGGRAYQSSFTKKEFYYPKTAELSRDGRIIVDNKHHLHYCEELSDSNSDVYLHWTCRPKNYEKMFKD